MLVNNKSSQKLSGLLTLWRTTRYLRPGQIVRRITRHIFNPGPDLKPAPPLRQLLGRWAQPARRPVTMLGPDHFCFLNQTHSLADVGWDDPSLEKLWRYNLHYFDDLTAREAEKRQEWHRAIIQRWIRENPPGKGTAWEPYPTSVRIVNWIKWALQGNTLPSPAVETLAIQTRWLFHRLEFHLRGNHLLSNAKALLFAGLFFEGAEAVGWFRRGLRLLEQQVQEQFLPDGGHFERSTMYHALVLEDLFDIRNIMSASCFGSPEALPPVVMSWQERIGSIRNWLAALCHPDGEIAFFNDAAFGIAPPLSELDRYANDLGFGQGSHHFDEVTSFTESGYVRIDRDNMVALLDVAPIAVDYLPGHAHADTLSFELSLHGRRVLVNSGVSCYEEGVERIRQRGTESHNTLRLDGGDSSEVWGGFRVGRRARVRQVAVWRDGKALNVEAAHDGYRHLPGRPIHLRKWSAEKGVLCVEDTVRGSGNHLIEVYYHLHPDLVPKAKAEHTVSVEDRCGRPCCLISLQTPGALQIENSTWHPGFGVSVPSSRIVFRVTCDLPASCLVRIEY